MEFLGIRLGCREAVIFVGEFVAGNLHHLSLEWGKRACYSICQLLLGDQSRWGSITIDSPFWLAFAGSSPPRPLRHAAAGLDGGRPGEGKDIWEVGDWQDNLGRGCFEERKLTSIYLSVYLQSWMPSEYMWIKLELENCYSSIILVFHARLSKVQILLFDIVCLG